VTTEAGKLKKPDVVLSAVGIVNVVAVVDDDSNADRTVFVGSLLPSSLSCSKTESRFSARRFSFSRSLSRASMLEIVGFLFSGKRSETENRKRTFFGQGI